MIFVRNMKMGEDNSLIQLYHVLLQFDFVAIVYIMRRNWSIYKYIYDVQTKAFLVRT